MVNVISNEELTSWTTPELKNHILELVKDRHLELLRTKVEFYKNELAPYCAELSQRNPFPQAPSELGCRYGLLSLFKIFYLACITSQFLVICW